MDVNSEGRQAASRPGREEVMMENTGCERGPLGGGEGAGQTAESRAQLVSSVYRREAFGGVQRGGAETEADG